MSIGVDPAQSNGPVNVLIAGSAPGLKGDTGVGIASAQVNAAGELVLIKTDGTSVVLPLDAVVQLAAMQAATTIGTNFDDLAASVVSAAKSSAAAGASEDIATEAAATTQALHDDVQSSAALVKQQTATAQALNQASQQAIAGVASEASAAAVMLTSALLGQTPLTRRGYWDASANTPALATGVGTDGDLYQVSRAGTTALDGNASWQVGDAAYYLGGQWHYFARAGWPAVALSITALSSLGVGDARVFGASAGGALEIVDKLGAVICVINPDGSYASSVQSDPQYALNEQGVRAGALRILDDLSSTLRIADSGGSPMRVAAECVVSSPRQEPVTRRPPGAYDDAEHGYTVGDNWSYNGRVWQCRAANAGRALWTQMEDVPPMLGGRFGTATAAACGTIRLVPGYTGALVDLLVSKNSGERSIVTIGQDAQGRADPLGLRAAATGLDGKTYLWIARLYDQTGNGNDMTVPGFSGGAAAIDTSLCPRIGIRRTDDGIDLISWSGGPSAIQYLQFPGTLSLSAAAFSLLMLGAVSCTNSPPQASYTLASLGSAAGQAVSLTLGGNTESGRVTVGDYDPLTVTGTSTVTLNTRMGLIGCSGRGGDTLFVHAPDSGVLSAAVKLPSGFSQRTFAGGAIGASLLGGGNAIANSVAMQLAGIVLTNRALSDGEVSAASVDMQAAYGLTPQIRVRLDCLGSSTTQGYLNPDGWCWPQMLEEYTDPLQVRSWAVPGSTAADCLANTLGNVLADATAATRKWAITWLGNNDLTGGQSVATIIANNASIHSQLRAAGYERLFILGQYNAALNVAVMQAVKSGAIDADGFIDVFAYEPLTHTTDTAIYHDGTHPTPPTDRLIASVVARTLQRYM